MGRIGGKHETVRKVTHPLCWFGGKFALAGRIINLTPRHQIYVEPFAGGGHVFFAKDPSPVEVLNDLDSDLTNFYEVLRDPELFVEFERMVNFTPYSREVFAVCQANYSKYNDPVKRAWAFFVRYRQARDSLPQSSWSYAVGQSRRGMSTSVSRWVTSIDGLPDVHQRLRGVQVENRDFADVIDTYDNPATWFYCDPPYLWETRKAGKYMVEMSDADHLDLIDILLDLKGMCLLSGYKCDMYEPLETMRLESIIVPTHSGATKEPRQENLWLSPNLLMALNNDGKVIAA